jgi:hypothetical protein
VIRQQDSRVELWIAKNKEAFRKLMMEREEIERDFGQALEWYERPGVDTSKIFLSIEGGYKLPPDQWPTLYAALTTAMVNLDRVMRPRVAKLRTGDTGA